MLEPNTPLIWNWHLDAVCLHLEAVTHGKLLARGLPNRLLINVPPGSMKSLLVSVMWNAWEWGPLGLRSNRFLSTSFNDGPVKRDVRKSRDLILSEWFTSLWPEMNGANERPLKRAGETSFENWSTGTREGVAFGSLTSQRGDRLIIDDPHSTETAESPAERANTTRKFREGAINRLNDMERSAIVVIMQRLHEDDVSGTILKLKMGYTHLMLPMEFELDRAFINGLGFADPRLNDGDLLDPVRFPRSEIARLKSVTTSYAYAGQYQQRPTAREGGLFKREWFKDRIISAAPPGTVWVRHWDLAATKGGTGARTAGVKMGRTPAGRYVVANVVKDRWSPGEVKENIRLTAQMDGPSVMVSLPQDPGQAGKAQVTDFVVDLAGFNARGFLESGDKETRATPFAAQCEIGNVDLIAGEWIPEYIEELCLFPGATLKDQVDASSGAFARLVQPAGPVAQSGTQRRN